MRNAFCKSIVAGQRWKTEIDALDLRFQHLQVFSCYLRR
jgi:hypothetical protein